MRIACPTCDATYDVPDALIGTGRRLRCARCEHEWLVGPEQQVAPAMPPPRAADAVPPPMVEPRRPSPVPATTPPAPVGRADGHFAALALWAAWIGSGLVLGAMGTGAWSYRGPIMEAWPPAARVYLLFGATDGGKARHGAGTET